MNLDWIWIPIFFWSVLGVYSIKSAVEEGNSKMKNMKFVDLIKLFFKSFFYGPFTNSKLIGGTTAVQRRFSELKQYKIALEKIITEANTGMTKSALNNIKKIAQTALESK